MNPGDGDLGTRPWTIVDTLHLDSSTIQSLGLEPAKKRVLKPARGHRFGPELRCECGKTWAGQQKAPEACKEAA